MPDHVESRDALTARQLPEMQLSTAENPLTAPRLPPDGLNAAQRARHRFEVVGNAIGMSVVLITFGKERVKPTLHPIFHNSKKA